MVFEDLFGITNMDRRLTACGSAARGACRLQPLVGRRVGFKVTGGLEDVSMFLRSGVGRDGVGGAGCTQGCQGDAARFLVA
jgi:hypothetical protein